MSYRILNYSLEIIRNFIRSEKIQNKNYEYPQIILIVIYTGNNKWNAKRKFSQMQAKYILYGVLEKEEIESLLQKMNREEGGVNMLRENLMKEREGWFKQGEKKGEKRGENLGEKKSIITIVKSMLSYGEEEEKIKKYTGMTENQIKKIKKELEIVH